MNGEIMTNDDNCVLITGATGFLGTYIIHKLLERTQHEIVVLVRGYDKQNALQRLKRAWWEFPELINAIDKRIHILKGDISHKQLALHDGEYENLVKNVTHIIHTAADLRLNAPIEDLRKTNRGGTSNILELAVKAHNEHGLERFAHVSTAYVAGGRKGLIDEDSLTDEAGFLNNYEKSMYESEVEVKNSTLPLSIFRPSMIVGDSKTGYNKTFNRLYVPLKLYLNGKQRIIPINPSGKINLIPVDYVADAIVRLTFDQRAEGLTFHITPSNDSLPTLEELIKFIRQWALENLQFELPSPIFAPKLAPILGKSSSFKLSGTIEPYLNDKRQFSLENTETLMGKYQLDWQVYLPKILQFAVYMGFFHRSNRTVHEQILFRLKSSSRPVKYYDIIERKFKSRSTSEIHQEMLDAACSLRKLGIKPGDRVALISFNSSSYLIMDVAIGLVGGISVPIYYTNSIEEIKEIVEESESSILFIGIPGVSKKLTEWEREIKLISFWRETEHSLGIMGWDDFINLAGKSDVESFAPVDLDDIATIRYTSGTTGKPKGAVFTHRKLRWMAEYIASLPPWGSRNNEIFYISFLPVSSVIEGIMGTYSPYFVPAALNIYFLEDFQDLPQALPKVRPNVFIMVPRFYEKVWSSLKDSKLGKIYLKSADGLKKNILKKVVKRGVLKRTGLERCAQLIVGSAPISGSLLRSYHDLGIEIYNGYGLTEAPLVTINRIGTNRIGTVGEPLPSTRIKIAPDKEVMVKGPQVMQGYFKGYQNGSPPFKEGWLLTGDFGHITPEGSLVITGRKKELIVNSYGRPISPYKMECMLKNIPEISEAMLIGDGKPYCSCLLWVDEKCSIDSLNSSIKDINSKVSRPEEITKWVALENDLSIEGGDLTPTLKLKRNNIMNRFKDVINFIYEDGDCPEAILHLENMEDVNTVDPVGSWRKF